MDLSHLSDPMVEVTGDLIMKIVIAGFGVVGIEEYLKNFLPEKRSKWWALIMLPLSVGSFFAVQYLPLSVIGSILTIGGVQLAYETLIQGFRAVIDRVGGKVKDDAGSKGKWERSAEDARPPQRKPKKPRDDSRSRDGRDNPPPPDVRDDRRR